jgi:ribonuclease HII
VIAALAAELYRLRLLAGLETLLWAAGYELVAGVDEAGRGCLAGPVVAAAAIPDPRCLLPGVDDSKALDATQREALAAAIKQTAIAWSVAAVSAAEIDRSNILVATRRAMTLAVAGLRPRPSLVVTDAVPLRDLGRPCLAMIRGDQIGYAVACASILAKVERDRRMIELDRDLPAYGFAAHKGYGAPEHLAALARFGPSPEHRMTFRRVVPRRGDGPPATAVDAERA